MPTTPENPQVRVFVPTCGRPIMLKRALSSLCAQTFREWVAEVHNDKQDDPSPAHVIAEFRDSRIQLVQHPRNLGGTATFNLFFTRCAEPYYSLLEDDNWWEPRFLEAMLGHLRAHPDVVVAWCSQRVAEELDDGSWRIAGDTVRHTVGDASPTLIRWPQVEQLYGAVHSNGAMLVRSRPGDDFRTPRVEFTGVEGFRERSFPHPLLYVPEPLAWFAITKETHRQRSQTGWVAIQALLAASLLSQAPADKLDPEFVWSSARSAKYSTTSLLILVSLAHRQLRSQLRYTLPTDWLRLVGATLKRPGVAWAALTAHRRHPDWWEFLSRHTAARFRECGEPARTW